MLTMWVNINDQFKKDLFKNMIKHLKQKIFKRVKVYNVEIKWMTRKAQKNKKINEFMPLQFLHFT